MLNIIIIILVDGYEGYNLFNIYEPENLSKLNRKFLFLNFVEKNHFYYKQINENNSNYTSKEKYLEYINILCKKNISILADIRKIIYPISLNSSSNIYNEITHFLKK